MNIDPWRERDLPDPERMLARILDRSADDTVEMGIEHLDEPIRQPRRMLHVAAAAAIIVAIGGIGLSITQPDLTGAQPGGRPGLAPAPSPAPTASATAPTEVGPASSRTPQPTRTTRAPAAKPAPSMAEKPSATPTPTPGTTATPGPSPTPSPIATPRPQMPSIAVVNTARFEVGDAAYLTINYRVCAGSAPASLRGPLIAGVRPNAANGSGAMASSLVDGTVIQSGDCRVFSDTWQTEAQSGQVSVHVTPSGDQETEWTDYYAATFS